MGSARAIREAIQYLAGTHDNEFIVVADAEVTEVDQPNRVCTVALIDGKVANIRDDARLMCAIDDGILILPTVGSTVTIILSTFTDPLVIGFSGVDSIILKGGDLGGLAIVPALIKKINNIENMLNDLASKYNSHTHPVVSTGAPTGSTSTQETTTLIPTQQSEIENTSITHGK